MKAWKQCVAALAAALVGGTASAAAQKIQVWHALDPSHAAIFEAFVGQYNKSQSEVAVELSVAPSFEAMESGVAQAIRDKRAPHFVQLPDFHNPEGVARDNRVMPLHELLAKHPIRDLQWFLPQTTSYVRDGRGRLLALPLMAEAPVMFYNRDLFQKAGLNPDAPARTWMELQAQLIKLQQSGVACPYATSDMVWIHQENLAASNNQPFATRNNGLDGGRPELLVNGMLHIRHMALMKSWVKSSLFPQISVNSESDAPFARGECAVLTSGTGAWAQLDPKRFSAGLAPIPRYLEASKEGGMPLIGGSALWALAGHPAPEQAAMGKFVAWLATPAVAAQWHQSTGYLPMTEAAARAADVSFYNRIPGAKTMVDLMDDTPGANSRGLRLQQYPKVLTILNEEMAAILQGNKPPMQAQGDAVRRASAAMAGK